MYEQLISYINTEVIPHIMPQTGTWAIAFVTFLAACIGSYLNVVIFRNPINLEIQEHEYLTSLGFKKSLSKNAKRMLLSENRSICLHCGEQLKFYNNVPIVSFLLQKGRCSFCNHKLSWQYFLIEISTTALALLCFTQLFSAILSVEYLLMLGILAISLVIITLDFRHKYIMDNHSVVYCFLVLLYVATIYDPSADALFLSVCGISCFWLIGALIAILKRRSESIGCGDFPLIFVGLYLTFQGASTMEQVASSLWGYVSILMVVFFLTIIIRLVRSKGVFDPETPFAPSILVANGVLLVTHTLT